MNHPDLNLLTALNVLLAEGSVARAAARLQLSPSAMSRTLARLRAVTGDPLLVRVGRGLVPTPRAVELRERASLIVKEAEEVLRPQAALDLMRLDRAFTLRTSDGFVEHFGPDLVKRVSEEAPLVQLRFTQKPVRDDTPLKDGSVDLEVGVVSSATSPDLRTQALLRDRFIGVVREDHPLAGKEVSPMDFADARHVEIARHCGGPIDRALASLGLTRTIAVVVSDFSNALCLARRSDLIATVPEVHTAQTRRYMFTFSLPFEMPLIPVAMLWHPRMDADPAHRWLRGCVRDVCSGNVRDSVTTKSGASGSRATD